MQKEKHNKRLFLGIGALVIVILVALWGLWLSRTINEKNSALTKTKSFSIQSGEGAGEIAERLEDEQLIKSSFAFVFYLNLKRAGDGLQVGDYQIPQNLNIPQVAEIITKGRVSTNKITFPEGWDIQKMAARLEAKNLMKRSDFLNQAKAEKYRSEYSFLKGVPAGASLEGFLYPDTYEIGKSVTPDQMIRKMLNNFQKRTEKYQAQMAASKMSEYEIVNLASIVEREVAKPEDRKLVASVFLNRLDIGMALESCATIQYILQESKKQFTYEETRTPSAYNTYLNRGLPAGPIGNPSLDSIVAVLSPQDSDFLYFLSSGGVTYFSKTFQEHEAKKAKYL